MTTPERLRRRQRREEILLIVLGLLVGATSIYFHGQDVNQRQCFADNFTQLSSSLSGRSDIAGREARAAKLESTATRLESAANNDFYKAAFASTSQAEVRDAYRDYQVAAAKVNRMRAKVDHRRERIAVDRAEHPIPDFPEGTCG